MIYLSTNSKEFPFKEAEQLYEDNKKYFLPLDIPFMELSEGLNGNFWSCFKDGVFIGCIYFELKDDKWFLSGFSKRKTYKYISEAIRGLCKLYFGQVDTIYSETPFTHAQRALKRAGFQQIDKDLFRIKDK